MNFTHSCVYWRYITRHRSVKKKKKKRRGGEEEEEPWEQTASNKKLPVYIFFVLHNIKRKQVRMRIFHTQGLIWHYTFSNWKKLTPENDLRYYYIWNLPYIFWHCPEEITCLSYLGSSKFECHAVNKCNSTIHINTYQIETQSPQIPNGD
jgi:hypothetical protein